MRTVAELVKEWEDRQARRREIRRLRDAEHLTLEQIGLKMGITKQRVSQILSDDPGWQEDTDAS